MKRNDRRQQPEVTQCVQELAESIWETGEEL